MLVNNFKVSEKQIVDLFKNERKKEFIKLSYNYYKLIDIIIKTRKIFNIIELLKKSDQELNKIKAGIELPMLDRKDKNNLSFGKSIVVPNDFKNRIKIEL